MEVFVCSPWEKQTSVTASSHSVSDADGRNVTDSKEEEVEGGRGGGQTERRGGETVNLDEISI